ncbi:hypothetical protein GCM10022419_057620 [Nonomuraea rosea]|uniref:Uncharacterized protein n=1 Tax=Nonomuraea rosea TaxID=638574 RepID=A0ABP6XLZ7_9ACTN
MLMPFGTGSRAARSRADSADWAGCDAGADAAADGTASSPDEHPAKTIMLRDIPEMAFSMDSSIHSGGIMENARGSEE